MKVPYNEDLASHIGPESRGEEGSSKATYFHNCLVILDPVTSCFRTNAPVYGL